MVYVIQVCWQLASRIRTELVLITKPNTCTNFSNLFLEWNSTCFGQFSKTPDFEQRNCPKHVESYSKDKFDKLVHLVGFIIRIYHDAWSRERQSVFFILCLLDMHHFDSWIKIDQLDVTCFFISLFNAQHVSDVLTSETRWALNNEIKKQVTPSLSLFIQL